ncbi:MAG: hypothetical protein V4587_12795 [Acidobacteriota bacterium]
MHNQSSRTRMTVAVLVWAMLLIAGISTAWGADNCESIHANAVGTSTQLGKLFPIKFLFCKPSTPEDRQVLIDAFKKDKNVGLTRALGKMHDAGRISTPSLLGYDIAYYTVTPTATGRQIRFVTDRLMAFGELYYNTRTRDYSLTAGVLDINDKDVSKSTGVLYPAAQLTWDKKKGQLTWELNQNPWKLQNFLDFGNKDDN